MSQPVFTSVAVGKDKKVVAKPTHQVIGDAEFPPKYIYVNRDTSLPSAFQGSETWCEFSLPREMGVLDNVRLVLDVTNGSGSALACVPATHFLSRYEITWGTQLVETIYADDNFHEVIGMEARDYATEIAPKLNVSKNFDLETDTIADGVSRRFFVPLSSHLTAMRPFLYGFSDVVKIRVYFASRVSANPVLASTNPTGTLTLNEAQLYVSEAQMSRAEWERADKLHKTGIVDYSIVIKEKQSDALSFTAGGTTPQYLRSFKHDSAGLLVYVQSQGASRSGEFALAPLKDITLVDSVGNKLTEAISHDFAKTFVFTDQVDSAYTTQVSKQQPEGANMYLIPFSASFKDTLRTGNNFGKRSMTSQERLIYSPASSPALNTAPVSATNDPPTNHTRGGTPTNAIVNVLSYSYGHIVCNRGKAHVSMVSTDEKSCGKSW